MKGECAPVGGHGKSLWQPAWDEGFGVPPVASAMGRPATAPATQRAQAQGLSAESSSVCSYGGQQGEDDGGAVLGGQHGQEQYQQPPPWRWEQPDAFFCGPTQEYASTGMKEPVAADREAPHVESFLRPEQVRQCAAALLQLALCSTHAFRLLLAGFLGRGLPACAGPRALSRGRPSCAHRMMRNTRRTVVLFVQGWCMFDVQKFGNSAGQTGLSNPVVN